MLKKNSPGTLSGAAGALVDDLAASKIGSENTIPSPSSQDAIALEALDDERFDQHGNRKEAPQPDWLYRHEAPPLPGLFEAKMSVLEAQVRAASPENRIAAFERTCDKVFGWRDPSLKPGTYSTLRWRVRDLAFDVGLQDQLDDLVEQSHERSVRKGPAPWVVKPVYFDPTPYAWTDPSKLPRRQWLYGKHLIRGYASAIVAAPGIGKSSLALVEAAALASGRDLLGIQPTDRCCVWVWNGEDPHEELERRVGGIAKYYGLGPADLDGWLHLDSGRDTKLIIAKQTPNGAKIAEPVTDALVNALGAAEVDVMVVDPFVSSHEVAENDNGAMDAVVKKWSEIADKANCAIQLVHHTRKANGVDVTMEASRGASSFIGAIRAGRVLNVMDAATASKYGVTNRHSFFRADDGKASMAPHADTADWYQFHSVGLGNGTPGALQADQDWVGVVDRWSPPDLLAGVTGADWDKASAAIKRGRWRENVQAKNWVGHPIAEALELDLGRPADNAKAKALIKLWIKSGALIVKEGMDEQRRRRNFVEVNDEE